MTALKRFGIVVIARNEGERFKRCVASLPQHVLVIYVDSGSTDESVQWARANGIEVVELDAKLPFTAARARNAGFRRLMQIAPNALYVQFIDGDCELATSWPDRAICYLESNPNQCAVFRAPARARARQVCLQFPLRRRVGRSSGRSIGFRW